MVAYFFAPVSPIVVLTVPKVFFVGSSAETAPLTFAVTTHQVQPVIEATRTAPHENFSQTGTPSICRANARVKLLSLEASPTSSLAVGILAKVLPSLLFTNPLGGQTGDGDGVIFAFFVAATTEVCAE